MRLAKVDRSLIDYSPLSSFPPQRLIAWLDNNIARD